jgi:gamma-glutamylcyclotransferase (GGCT)/AIG2-like uncharacterized protein YtfP
MRFFFYGTLMDEAVRHAVLGARAPASVEAAHLDGWRCVAQRGVSYPALVKARGARVDGVLVRGLDARAARLLAIYEGDDGYRALELLVRPEGRKRGVPAQVFVPIASKPAHRARRWDFALWQRRDKPALLARIKTWMQERPRG